MLNPSISRLFKKKNDVVKAILKNQHSLIHLAHNSTTPIHLKPKYADGGHIEHYHHLIFDLLLPLSLVLDKCPVTAEFTVENFGILVNHVQMALGPQFIILDKPNTASSFQLEGMNPTAVPIHYFKYSSLKNRIVKNLNAQLLRKRNKVILIERKAPDKYYLDKAVNKGAGTTRRSIKNHQQVAQKMADKISSRYTFMNVALEDLTLQKKIELFHQAYIVIGQHGAGLSNILWTKKKTHVFEFGFENGLHFQKLSQQIGLEHHFQNYSDPHISISPTEAMRWVNEETKKPIFKID